jgi:DNA-binding response OmpR family regulator
MAEGSRILLVEDDPALAREIVRALERDQWPIDHVGSLGEAFEAVIQFPYRAILLDRRLPDGDGIGLIPAARSRASPPSIIFLTARDDLADRVEGLDAGADDYLVKPFALEELLARLRAACRRPGQSSTPPPIEVARLSFDPGTREVRSGGRAIAVPRRELALLELLVRRAGRVVQRGHLESELYGLDVEVSANALEALVSRLRRRLEEEDSGVELRTVRGVGYMLQPC